MVDEEEAESLIDRCESGFETQVFKELVSRVMVMSSKPFLVAVAAMSVGVATEQVSALNTTLKETQFSDANGWNQPQYYGTIQFPDLNGDSKTDVCGRGIGGINCAVDDGTGRFINGALWNSTFSDANGGNAAQYYSTIQFPNVSGDSEKKADLCGRGGGGVWCAVSTGTTFGTPSLWNSNFSDANGWNAPQYYSTIQFPDLNNDGKADLCGRGSAGILCALSSGSTFGTPTLWNSSFSDANGWTAAHYYRTIAFPDVNGDKRADVCGRGNGGIWCALSTGTTFGAATLWNSSFSDAAGWTAPRYYSTIQYSDVDGKGRADVCARGIGGILCAVSTGSSFGSVTVWNAEFSDAKGWTAPHYYETIRIVGGVLCGRGTAGIWCAFSNEANAFTNLFVESTNESDANGWTLPQYYKTIRLTADLKIAGRGTAGIYTSPVFTPDKLSINTVTDLNNRRTALINKVWGRTSVDTVQGVDDDNPPATIDVQPLPGGVTVRRYKMYMPTSGGSPSRVPGGLPRVEGLADHFIPSGGSNKLVILNPGHACNYTSLPYQDAETVIEMLNAGYAVLATYMPLATPLECSGGHNDLFDPSKNLRPANGGHPLIYFLDPVRRGLNYALSHFTYTQVFMAGLSGGGWTTTLYAALDTRITTSIVIAGSEPFYMRPTSDAEQEDVPAAGNDFFNFSSGGSQIVTGYKDLYLLGSYGAGRRHIQVLNRNDDCCFGQYEYLGAPAKWDQAVRAYEREVRERVQALGTGSFRVEINEAVDCVVQGNCGSRRPSRHEFSKNTRVAIMLAEFDGGSSLLGAANGTYPFARGMNGRLWRNDGPSTTWTDTGLSMVGTPAVVTGAISGHTYDVFYRDPSNHPVHAYYNGTSWVATTNLSGVVISDPAAVSWGPGRIDVVALGTDYKLYHWRYSGAWAPFKLVHASALGVGPIALTSSGPNHLDIFFRGHDAGLYHIRSTGGPPFTLENTGGIIKSFPSAVSSGNSLWSYVTGTNHQLYQALQTTSGGAWSWMNLSSTTGSTGTKVLGSPSAYRSSTGTVQVYSRINGSAPNQVGVFRFTSPSWTFSNQNGVPRLGSPSANSLGAFIVSPTNQSSWRLDVLGWHGLGGYVDR